MSTASNVGGFAEVFKQKVIEDFEFRTLQGGTNITITQNADDIEISETTPGEITLGANVGSGTGLIFRDKTSATLNFKSLIAGSNITITNNADDITIDAAADMTTASNLGSGTGVFAAKVIEDLQFKSLVAGDNITITSTATEITIVGEDITIDVRNVSGVLIDKGSPVYISGASGNNTTIELAKADALATMPSIGIVLADIANNSNGQVVSAGKIGTLDTSSFIVGDILFVDESTAGLLTTTPPSHPNLRQFMAVVLVSNVATGEIQVLTGDVSGAEEGTIFNSFDIGDGLTGAKDLGFTNDNGRFSLKSTGHTTDRTQTLQDADGVIALLSDIVADETTASNVGTGVGVFKQKLLEDLEFKSLLANAEVLIANNTNDLAFSIGAIAISKITGLQTELDSKIDTVVNVGTGAGLVFRDKVAQTANLKSLLAGTGITITNNADDIEIEATGGTPANVKAGSTTVALDGTTTVTFNTAFSGVPNVVVSMGGDVDYADNEKGYNLSVYSITVNGFTIRFDAFDGNHDPATFHWVATDAGDP